MQDFGTITRIGAPAPTGAQTPRVVGLDSHPARVGQVKFAQVDAYWTARCQAGQPPRRTDIDPRGIEGALGNAFVLERITPTEARLRVGGQSIGDLLGMEPRGMPFSALIEPAARGTMQDVMAHLFDDPAICGLSLSATAGIGRPALTARLMLWPLRDEDGAVTRALGCLVASGQPGRGPRRFAIDTSTVTHMTSAHMTFSPMAGAAPRPAPAARAAPEPGRMAEDAEAFAPAPRPHLRLIKTD